MQITKHIMHKVNFTFAKNSGSQQGPVFHPAAIWQSLKILLVCHNLREEKEEGGDAAAGIWWAEGRNAAKHPYLKHP